jgi:hypothetical protein
MPMDDGDRHEDISRLEAEIEDLADTAERCRKIILVSKLAIACGAILLLALLVRAIKFDPLAMIGAITLLIGGTVAFGANTSTLQQKTGALRAAEARRAELIGSIELRLVGEGTAADRS